MRGLFSLMLATPLLNGCGDSGDDKPSDTGTETTDAGDGADDGGGTGEPTGADEDGDGVTVEDGDCDDTDATIYPGASEVWDDGIDQDCDGVADVEGSACSADLSVTFPDGSSTTLDGCADWDFDATFDYDPNAPPEVTSFTFTLGATADADLDCQIQLVQENVCGRGYYDERENSTTTTTVLMDCPGVSDAYKDTFVAHEGYLRIDAIEAGSVPGSFTGVELPTTVEGHLHVWTPEGIDIRGDLSLSLIQIAGDAEEPPSCANVPDETLDLDGDGFISRQYFDGNDCDDTDPTRLGIGDCDGDDVPTSIDCDDGDPEEIGSKENDRDCDGVLTGDDCNDDDPSVPVADWTFSGSDWVECSETMGTLTIAPGTTDLSSLDTLTHVRGDLIIVNTSLTELTGLSSLTTIDGMLWIKHNDTLTSIALESLTNVGHDVDIQANEQLTTASFASLADIGGSLYIDANELLSSFTLDSLTEVDGVINIVANQLLCESLVAAFIDRMEALGWSGPSLSEDNADC